MEKDEGSKGGWGEPLVTLELDMSSWKSPHVSLPLYYEMWNWEGDTEVLPGKWFDVIKAAYDQDYIKRHAISQEVQHAFCSVLHIMQALIVVVLFSNSFS